MSARPPFPPPDPVPSDPPQQPEGTTPGDIPPAIKLTQEELSLLRQFFELLDEWGRKKKVA